MGRGLAFDPSRYFIVCCNVLGSPYGSSSPVTINPSTGHRWGPEFPLATVRDDVRLHRIVLDYLGVKSVAIVIGGSMGGMQVLEWACCYPPPYVRNIIPMATSAHHSAWGISWGEAQRQSIYSDPNYEEGYYTDENAPKYGLGAARMAALLTYRSRDSFESRFGRKEQQRRVPSPATVLKNGAMEAQRDENDSAPSTPAEHARSAHNDGYRPRRTASSASLTPSTPTDSITPLPSKTIPNLPSESSKATSLTGAARSKPLVYSAQSYLRYQGDKFVSRFDANCYISITRKMDSHDVCRGRPPPEGRPDWHPLNEAPPQALVLAISSDALFTLSEQKELADTIPDSTLVIIDSPEGHDGFLLEFEQINEHICLHLKDKLPEMYTPEALLDAAPEELEETVEEKLKDKKESLFGETEADVTAW
jgi:homoserine O-acetyltransferase